MFEDREDVPPVPPCLILAHSDLSFATAVGQALRRLGWDVYLSRSGAEARRLAGMLSPRLIVLGTELPDESGWLACDKLTAVLPHTRVILLADTLEPRSERFAAFVGAEALVSRGSFPIALPLPGDRLPEARRPVGGEYLCPFPAP